MSKIVGAYKLIDRIAEGGFGVTYKALHNIVEELVCLKHCSNISDLDEEILISEAKAAWNLRHYSIASIRDLFRFPDGSMGLVMSYIPGPTIEQIIDKTGPLDPEHVAWISERVLNGLRYIHHEGVVHGDLKPQNIIVQPVKHMAVIIDYGLSEVKPSRKSSARGYTPYFAPPEQIDRRPLVPQSDYFALGMTMIYMLGGEDKLLRKEVPADTPEPMKKFIQRLIRRDVTARPRYGEEDLYDTFVQVRFDSFGRYRSSMKPIPGFETAGV